MSKVNKLFILNLNILVINLLVSFSFQAGVFQLFVAFSDGYHMKFRDKQN